MSTAEVGLLKWLLNEYWGFSGFLMSTGVAEVIS